ncbi:MAG TPA: ZIP family metal transporter [Syntrophomonas sp.]|nr:ZIP family metal transporter [Syntrophomonas sp.]HRW12996.1 ZIP family metal transporter [Syntrophomonas sp.]
MNNALWWSFLAGFSTSIGAALLFLNKKWRPRHLAYFLGLAAGVMTAVVFFDMLPSALVSGSSKALSGVVIGLLLMFLTAGIQHQGIHSTQTLVGLGYMIMLGIALHDLPEGMAVALGEHMKNRTGMVIALGIGIHNMPEGMAIAAPLLMSGMKKSMVLLQTLLISLITPLGTLLGSFLLHLAPGLMPLMLGIASGVMLYLVIFQLWPQAGYKNKSSRWPGFCLGMLVIGLATYL